MFTEIKGREIVIMAKYISTGHYNDEGELIKVCPDPGCGAVYHNCPKKQTRCNDCGGNIMQINEDTFWKRFSNNWFQYDFLTGEYYRPQKEVYQLSLDLE